MSAPQWHTSEGGALSLEDIGRHPTIWLACRRQQSPFLVNYGDLRPAWHFFERLGPYAWASVESPEKPEVPEVVATKDPPSSFDGCTVCLSEDDYLVITRDRPRAFKVWILGGGLDSWRCFAASQQEVDRPEGAWP